MDLFRWLELAALGLFLGLASYRAVHLRLRHGVSDIAFDRQNRLAIGAFVITWCWALAVLWYALPIGGHALLPPLDLPVWRWLPSRLVGAGMVAAGSVLNLFAHVQLGDNWRLGIGQIADGQLITTGVYAYSRHPIYLFFNLYFAGTLLVEGRPVLLPFWLVVCLLLHFEALREERFLEVRFGAAWREYRRRVRRYWGRGPAVDGPTFRR